MSQSSTPAPPLLSNPTAPVYQPSTGTSGNMEHEFPEEDLRLDGEITVAISQLILVGDRIPALGLHETLWRLKRYVSIKIMTCEVTRVMKAGKADELKMLQKIANADRPHPGKHHVLEYYETFDIEGPQGTHCCVVTEPLGFSLQFLRSVQLGQGQRMPLEDIADVIRHVLLGLDYLHNSCGIIHTDIKFDNILLRPDDVTACIGDALLNESSETYQCDTRARPPVVPILSQPLWIYSPGVDIQTTRTQAVIADFSHSHWVHRHFRDEIQAYALRAPEVILGYDWNAAVDVWSVGCLAAEMLTDFWLFEPKSEPGWDRNEDHIERMTEVIGEHFPPDMLEKCKHREKYFKEDGSFAHFTDYEEPMPELGSLLEQRSYLMRSFPHEVEAALKFLKRCLKLRPEDRESPAELAKDPWLLRE